MLKNRIIPCLLLKDGGLVKSTKFRNDVYVGDPLNAIKIFNEKEVDEIVLLDINATITGKGPNFRLLEEVASECFMPLSYGGGISSLDQMQRLFAIGVEKIVLNSALHINPTLVRDAVNAFGGQAIVASIDVKNKFFGGKEVMVFSGKKGTNIDPIKFSKYVESLGVGEILLTSVDRDGLMKGYDIELIRMVSCVVNIPVIASGGAGEIQDFKKAIKYGEASAAAAGSMFVFYGPHKAVLISYPDYQELRKILEE